MLNLVMARVKSPDPKREYITITCLLQKKWTTVTNIERQHEHEKLHKT